MDLQSHHTANVVNIYLSTYTAGKHTPLSASSQSQQKLMCNKLINQNIHIFYWAESFPQHQIITLFLNVFLTVLVYAISAVAPARRTKS